MIDGLPDPLPAIVRNGAIETRAVAITTSTQFLGPSPKRVALLLSIQPGTNAVINNRPIASATDGFSWVSGQTPIYLDRAIHGDIVKKPWFVFLTGAASTVSWLEVLDG